MAEEYWKTSPFGERSLFSPQTKERQRLERLEREEREKQQKNLFSKTLANVLIVLDKTGKNQFDDTKNTIWRVFYIPNLADYSFVGTLIDMYSFKNLCIVHHGNLYSDKALAYEVKPILNFKYIEAIEKVIGEDLKQFSELSEDYFENLKEKSKTRYIGGLPLNSLKAYYSLRALISNIENNGNYVSVACDEADDERILKKLAEFNEKNIKVYANSNYTIILRYWQYRGIKDYGSILNSFLTSSESWIDDSGWKYYDKSQNETIVTKKDMWIYSKHKSKIFDLISRKKQLTSEQIKKEEWAQTYFSKGFELQYKKKYGETAYSNYINTVELAFPDFKQ